MSSIENERQYASPQAELKHALLRGELTPLAFCNQAMVLDQQTPSRDAADANIALLSDPEVAAACTKDGADFAYDNLLSVSYFHRAQQELLDGSASAVSDLQAALAVAQRHADSGYQGWVHYVEATLAYAQGDTAALETTLAGIPAGANRSIAENLLQGLRLDGGVYSRDYNRETPEEFRNQ